MANSFTIKTIRVTFTLGKGAFPGDRDPFSKSGRVKTIEGLACDVVIDKPGPPQKNSATVTVWGLSPESMGLLAMLAFKPLESHHNLISIVAGDKDGSTSRAFKGEITRAYADFSGVPNTCMHFEASSGTYPQQKRSHTLTINGEAPVDNLFKMFAHEAGYAYSNQGVTGSVGNSWYPGTPVEKMAKLARDIGCDMFIDDGLVVVLPKDKPRRGDTIFLSAANGMIGYPSFNNDGISCRCLYHPGLRYGGLVRVKSVVAGASGLWRITGLSHHLSAYNPHGGPWESRIQAVPVERRPLQAP